jgi:hypothetical protein
MLREDCEGRENLGFNLEMYGFDLSEYEFLSLIYHKYMVLCDSDLASFPCHMNHCSHTTYYADMDIQHIMRIWIYSTVGNGVRG